MEFTGGKGTIRRKRKVVHKTTTAYDKRLQSTFKRIGVNAIPAIKEVNIFKEDIVNYNELLILDLQKLLMDEYGPYDSSGTDDDFPPPHQNRMSRGGRISGNGRPAAVGSMPYTRMYEETDMEAKIHQLEQEAYSSVLRAFKAQADAISWEKEGLITELRKELRLSNEEHRDLLNRVNADETIRRIREWRQSGVAVHNATQASREPVPSPSISASRKKQKMGSSIPSQSFGGPTSFHPQSMGAANQPSSSAAKRGPMMGAKGKKHKSMPPGASSMKMQYPSGPAGRGQFSNRIAGGLGTEPVEGASFDSLIGRKVRTRWPDDNNFYEAVITNYNPIESARSAGRSGRGRLRPDMGESSEIHGAPLGRRGGGAATGAEVGRHCLVYDLGTTHETIEWVDLTEAKFELFPYKLLIKPVIDCMLEDDDDDTPHWNESHILSILSLQISPEDIQWEGEDPGISHHGGYGGPGHGSNRHLGRDSAPGAGRGRTMVKGQSRKDFQPSQNGIGKKGPDDIQLLHTDTLIKEVERVFSSNHPDPVEIEKAKKVLKEHEQSLTEAIARLGDLSDGESDEGGRFSHAQGMDRE
ncbi:hypothetical protein SASPL_113644 [Salvia splendens]|uniref:ENT domain-containing protein n=1 Tax=Salvia splendens TaxID=180675 RepID=A0A8X9A194_SALSN|nr:hypothetical protein SASPL_113644 [Salvia splendens]